LAQVGHIDIQREIIGDEGTEQYFVGVGVNVCIEIVAMLVEIECINLIALKRGFTFSSESSSSLTAKQLVMWMRFV
jgi:hypothetical protein